MKNQWSNIWKIVVFAVFLICAHKALTQSPGLATDTLYASSIDSESNLVLDEVPSAEWNLQEGESRYVSVLSTPGVFFLRREMGQFRLYKIGAEHQRSLMNAGRDIRLTMHYLRMTPESSKSSQEKGFLLP